MFRTRLRFGCATHRLSELLVRDGERDMLRDTARDGHLLGMERVQPLRPELQAEFLIARSEPHRQHGSIPGGGNPLAKVWRIVDDVHRHVREVADDHERTGRELGRIEPSRSHRHRTIGVRRRLHHITAGLTVMEGHRQAIVGQHAIGDLRHAREHLADVEHFGECTDQFVRHGERRRHAVWGTRGAASSAPAGRARRDQRADRHAASGRQRLARRRHGLQSDTWYSLRNVPSGTGCASRANSCAATSADAEPKKSCVLLGFSQLRPGAGRGAAIAPQQAMIPRHFRLPLVGAALALTHRVQPQPGWASTTSASSDRLRRRGRARNACPSPRSGSRRSMDM